MVPGAGIEPARLAAGDFESPASTNFTTRATHQAFKYSRAFEFLPANGTARLSQRLAQHLFKRPLSPHEQDIAITLAAGDIGSLRSQVFITNRGDW